MGPELRDQGSNPFKKGEIDIGVLRQYLKMNRKIDEVVLNKLGRSIDQLNELTEAEAIATFNSLLNQQSLQLYIDIGKISLRPDIKNILSKVHEATAYAKSFDKDLIRKLNKALLFAVYMKDKVAVRKYERFAAAALMKTNVSLKPLPPFFGDVSKGVLVNLSAGGMALVMKDRLQMNSRYVLTASFRDNTVLKGQVIIKHALQGTGQHVHGFEFDGLPNFQKDKFKKMANDNNQCDKRIDRHELDICQLDCSFYPLCNKPHKK